MTPSSNSLACPGFDLRLTLNCGQVFHWLPRGGGWLGMIGDEPCHLEQHGDRLFVTPGMEEKAHRYLALDHDMERILASLPREEAMSAAAAATSGIRIIRQPFWECVATFITSAQKAVPHITAISHTLRQRFGRAVKFGDEILHAYPTPSALAALEESDLRACALGYRAKNLLKTARMVAGGEIDLDEIASLPTDAALIELTRLAGVGEKVANCALLFAYERLDAVPIDVWIARILRETYRKRRSTPAQLKQFANRHFGPFAGYAQQMLFHHARSEKAAASKGGKR
jgi:N-glycosylase/DNA lyase